MNFMGMGLAEIAVVMVVAFLVLGPNRTINLARTAGKMFADLRRTMGEVTSAISLEEKGQSASNVESPPPGSRPVAQPQPTQDESSSETSMTENTASENAATENAATENTAGPDPTKPDPSKNEDE